MKPSKAIDFFRMSKSKEAEKNILKLENLKIYDANFDRKLPITIKSKIWEFPINEVIKNYNYSNKKAIGFVDMMVSFEFPSYPILVGIDKKNVSYNWDYNKKYEYQLKDEDVAYIGDDLFDLAVMKRVGFPVTVADATEEAKSVSILISDFAGGKGAVRQIIEFILKHYFV